LQRRATDESRHRVHYDRQLSLCGSPACRPTNRIPQAMMKTFRSHCSALSVPATLVALIACLALLPGAAGASRTRAHAAATYLTGIGNESVSMFESPLYQRLHTKIVRYI